MSTSPSQPEPQPGSSTPAARPRLNVSKIAMWLAIGMLVLAALLGGYFIIVGDQSNVAGRAWMTLFLVGAFAGAVLIDTAVTRGNDTTYLAASTIINVILVAVGLLKIWNGFGQPFDTASAAVWSAQITRFIAVVLLLRAALAITQIYVPFAFKNNRGTATKIASMGTVIFGWITALILAIPAAFPEPEWPDWWWRTSGASALIAVVLLVIPPIIRAFEPRDESAQQAGGQQYAPSAYPQQPAPPQGYPQQYPPQGYAQQPGFAPSPEQSAYAQQQAQYAAAQQAAYAQQQAQYAAAQQQAQYAAAQQAAYAQQQAQIAAEQQAQYAAQQQAMHAQAQFDAQQAARMQAAAEAAQRSAEREAQSPPPPQ